MGLLTEYTLLGELGQGGFATVYKVRHNTFGYIRAIRVLNQTITDENSEIYQKFLRECKVLLRLGNGVHRNIVHIYQPRLLDNHALVEMDFVDGRDISHYLNENGNFLPIGEVLRMFEEMSGALAYCHEDIYKFCMDPDEDNLVSDPIDGKKYLIDEATRKRLIEKYKVIHNDIHSGNIMRRDDGSFVLLDFGLAITSDDDVRKSSRHENGAEEYKAPEKWDDDSIQSERWDIYSFGIVMFEYLAGRLPFIYDTTCSRVEASYKLMKQHMEQQPPSINYLRKAFYEAKYPGKDYEIDYPKWLEDAIMKCLEKDPAKRFRNGKELYEYIKKHINDGTVLEKKGNTDDNISSRRVTVNIENQNGNFDKEVNVSEFDEYLAKFNSPDERFDLSSCSDDEIKDIFTHLCEFAQKGHAESMCDLAYLYQQGIGTEKNLDKSFDWYLKSAELGFERAMEEIALLYEAGNASGFSNQPRNYHKAEKWYRLLINNGNPKGFFGLGCLYRYGCEPANNPYEEKMFGKTEDYFPSDVGQAFLLFTEAANRGYSPSMVAIGDLFRDGYITGGVEKAIEWYEKAKALGDFDAAMNLGAIYMDGSEYYDYITALKYYRDALKLTKDEIDKEWVKEKMVEVYKSLGNLYRYDNYQESIRWYQKAVEEGDNAANEELKELYFELGLNCYDDDDRAAKIWFEKAVSLGNEDAKKKLDEINSNNME